MNKVTVHIILISILLAGILVSCDLFHPEPTVIDSTTSINVTVNMTLELRLDTTSGIVNKDGDSPQVTFYGTICEAKSTSPVSGVTIRIAGTDTPGGRTISKSDGKWEITIPIIPQRNDENTTIFAIEVQKSNAVTAPLSEYTKDSVIWDLLEVKSPETYMVAGAYAHSLPWGNLYAKIECPIYVRLKEE